MTSPAEQLTAATERLIAAQCNVMLLGVLSVAPNPLAQTDRQIELKVARQRYHDTVAALMPASVPEAAEAPAEATPTPTPTRGATLLGAPTPEFMRGMEHAFSLVLAALRGDNTVAFPGNMEEVLGALEYHRDEISAAAYITHMRRLDALLKEAEDGKQKAITEGRASDSFVWEDRVLYLRAIRYSIGGAPPRIYRHTKTGGLYTWVGEVLLKGARISGPAVIYVDNEGRQLYARPKEEFDACFELVRPEDA